MTKTDETIKKDIVDQLYWDDRVDASDVKIDVNDGLVTLSGSAPNFNVLRAILEDSYAIREVDSIVNKLVIKYPDMQTLPTDYNLQTSIEGLLFLNASIDSSNIGVSVDDRIVTLEGAVDSYWKKLKISELVSDVNGVLGVDNQLAVVPSKKLKDKAIAEHIINAFHRNLFSDVEDIVVEVEDGMVTLTGKVPNRATFLTALNLAEHTAGVIGVENQLKLAKKE